ncbi:MAG: HEAT repeat domain-containing protein [Planctomycetes bacterium]|nr:HEAT repeat domain-containing protein [Planctomycetota bacterium]
MSASRPWPFVFLSILLALALPVVRADEPERSPAEEAKELAAALGKDDSEAVPKAKERLPKLGTEGAAAFLAALAGAEEDALRDGFACLVHVFGLEDHGIDAAKLDLSPASSRLESHDADLQGLAIQVLARAGDERSANALAGYFPDADEGVRATIQTALGTKRPEAAVAPFLEIATAAARERALRVAAIGVLGRVARSSAAEGLIALLSDPETSIRSEAANALKKISGRSDLAFDATAAPQEREKKIAKWRKWRARRDHLLALASSDEPRRKLAEAALSDSVEEDAARELAWALSRGNIESAEVRRAAARLIEKHVEKHAALVKENLVRAVEGDKDREVRTAAALALSRGPFGEDEKAKGAVKLLYERESAENARAALAEALYRLGDRSAFPTARAMLLAGSAGERTRATLMLGEGGGTKEVDLLLDFSAGKLAFPGELPSEGPSGTDAGADLASAVRSLERFSRRVANVSRSLSGAEEGERRAAVVAVGRIGSPYATRRLVELWSSTEAKERSAWALAGLAELAARRRPGILVELWASFDAALREGTDPAVRADAARALGHLGILSAAPALESGAKAEDARIRAACVEALSRLGDPTRLPVVEGALEDPDAAVRLAAARGVARQPESADLSAVLARVRKEEDAAVRRALVEVLALSDHPDAADFLAETIPGDDPETAAVAGRYFADWFVEDEFDYDPFGAQADRLGAAKRAAGAVRDRRLVSFLLALDPPLAPAAEAALPVDSRAEALLGRLGSDADFGKIVALGREAVRPLTEVVDTRSGPALEWVLAALARVVRDEGWDEETAGAAVAGIAANRALAEAEARMRDPGHEPDPFVAALASDVLLASTDLGESGRILLARLLPHLRGKRFAASARSLAQAGHPIPAEVIARLSTSGDPENALIALDALAALGPGRGFAGVSSLIDASDDGVRKRAAEILAGWKWPSTVAWVEGRLKADASESPLPRLAALARALPLVPGLPGPAPSSNWLSCASALREGKALAARWPEAAVKRRSATNNMLYDLARSSASIRLPGPEGKEQPIEEVHGENVQAETLGRWLEHRRAMALALADLASDDPRARAKGAGTLRAELAPVPPPPEALALAVSELLRLERPGQGEYRAAIIEILATRRDLADRAFFLSLAASDPEPSVRIAAARAYKSLLARRDWKTLSGLAEAGRKLDRAGPLAGGPLWAALAGTVERERDSWLAELRTLAASDLAEVRFHGVQGIRWLSLPEDGEWDVLHPFLAGAGGQGMIEIADPLTDAVLSSLDKRRESRRSPAKLSRSALLALPAPAGAGALHDIARGIRAAAAATDSARPAAEKDSLARLRTFSPELVAFRGTQHPTAVRKKAYDVAATFASRLGSGDDFLLLVPNALSAEGNEPGKSWLDAAVLDLEDPGARVRSAAHIFLRTVAERGQLSADANRFDPSAGASQRVAGAAAWRDWLSDVRFRRTFLVETERFQTVVLEVGEANLSPEAAKRTAASLGELARSRKKVARTLVADELLPRSLPALQAILLAVLGEIGSDEDLPVALRELDHPSPGVREAAYKTFAKLSTSGLDDRWLTTPDGAAPTFDPSPATAVVRDERAEALREAWKKEGTAREKSEFLKSLAKTRKRDAAGALERLRDAGRLASESIVRGVSSETAKGDPALRALLARILGELDRKEEVARALVLLLEDTEETVRSAAVPGLEHVTGETLGYSAGAAEAERAKAVEAWKKRLELLATPGEAESFWRKDPFKRPAAEEAHALLSSLGKDAAAHMPRLVEIYEHPDRFVPEGAAPEDPGRKLQIDHLRLVASRAIAETLWYPGARALVEGLRSGELAVRQQANEALKRMTGDETGFDPNGSEESRIFGVEIWLDWVEDHKTYLEGAPEPEKAPGEEGSGE